MYPDVPFVDRKETISHLRRVLNHSEDRMHVIYGRTGIGKSELATRFVHECRNEGYPVLHYELYNPKNEKIFSQRLLKEWFEKHPKPTIARIREYLLSPDAVDDLLSIVKQTVGPTAGLAIDSLQKAVTSISGVEVNFPDPVQLVVDVMKSSGTSNSPAVVVIDQYDPDKRGRQMGIEATFKDISRCLDDSVIWYIASTNKIVGNKIDCIQLEPFDQEITLNPGATYPNDRGVNENNSQFHKRSFEATRELVKKANLEFRDPDLIDLHDRTKGIPLLVASICSNPDTMSLQEELNDKPTTYDEFKYDIQRDFIRGLSDPQRQLLTKTSVMPIFARDICSKQTGIDELHVMELLDDLSKKAKLVEIRTGYANGQSYCCHDFHREFLINCANLNERELRQEAAVNRMRLAFEYYSSEFETGKDSSIELQLNQFRYQLSNISESKSLSEIGEIVTTAVDYSETDILELLSSYHNIDHRDYDLDDYLRQLV